MTEWITVSGRKVPVEAGQSKKEAVEQNVKGPQVGDPGTSNCQPNDQRVACRRKEKPIDDDEEIEKSLTYRNVLKTPFAMRDEVVYGDFKKSGIVNGIRPGSIGIFAQNTIEFAPLHTVFKKSELVGRFHWDAVSRDIRDKWLRKCNIPLSYSTYDWGVIPKPYQEMIKGIHPAGYGASPSPTHPLVWNPVNDDKKISERIEDEKKESAD